MHVCSTIVSASCCVLMPHTCSHRYLTATCIKITVCMHVCSAIFIICADATAAETYQKLMVEAMDLTSSAQKKKVQQFKSSATASRLAAKRGEGALRSQSTKARSWDAVSEEFSGVFAQHQKPPHAGEQDDSFGDFQSSNQQRQQQQSGRPGFAAFAAPNQHQVRPDQQPQAPPNTQPLMQGESTFTADFSQAGHLLTQSPEPYMPSSLAQAVGISGHASLAGQNSASVGQNAMQAYSGQRLGQGRSHMIATSSYHGPLSSSNVQLGMQGQSPNSPQAHSGNFKLSQSLVQNAPQIPGQPAGTYGGVSTNQPVQQSQFQMNPVAPSNVPQNLGTSDNVNFNPPTSSPTSNFSPPGSSDSPPESGGVNSSRFHPIYHKVFRRCRKPGEDFVSTELLYPVLLSSKLPRPKLRELWNIANRGRPGKLSQMELFVLLGLVALAQVRKDSGREGEGEGEGEIER